MKFMVQLQLAKLCNWLLARLAPNPIVYEQTLETTMTTLNALYGTSAVHKYLDSQETFLKSEIVKSFLDARQARAEFVAGRLYEVQLFRDKLKAAHMYVQGIKRDALSERK